MVNTEAAAATKKTTTITQKTRHRINTRRRLANRRRISTKRPRYNKNMSSGSNQQYNNRTNTTTNHLPIEQWGDDHWFGSAKDTKKVFV